MSRSGKRAEPNILSVLRANEADPDELEQLLLGHYGYASHFGSESWLGPKEKPPALRLIYNRDGRAVSLERGPSFEEAEIPILQERVAKQLLAEGKVGVGRRVLFAPVRTTASFRCGNWFQILPVPEEAPRPAYEWAKHPFLIEVQFQQSVDHMITAMRRDVAQRQVELLCAALINMPLEGFSRTLTTHWVADPRGSGFPSVHVQELYSWPNANLQGDIFTDTSSMATVELAPPQEYYTRLGISMGQTLDLPADFQALVGVFQRLEHREKEKFLRSAYWLQHAQEIWNASHSASFLAFVKAVEALMPQAASAQQCPTCGRSHGPSIRDRFADFLDDLVKRDVPEKSRKRFYALRSAMEHGGKLLRRDHALFAMSPKAREEENELSFLSRLVRIALHNWLAIRLATSRSPS